MDVLCRYAEHCSLRARAVSSGAKDKNQRISVRAGFAELYNVVYGKVSEIYGFGSEKILIVCAKGWRL